jgi:alginate O-acetyltransferase complex protein AlgI
MLFNSFSFLLLFLPLVLVGFFVIGRRSHVWGAAWLAAASICFYGWWSTVYIPLLLASIVCNYGLGWRIGHASGPARKRWLLLGLTANLSLLAYFKYADFFIHSVNALTQAQLPALNVILPIGISFFTFTQIAFLVDTYQHKVSEYRFVHYLLFVSYFPHLIAGPVLHHREMMPQFDTPSTYRLSGANIAVGLSIFTIGLAKKVLLADNLAPHAGFFFDQADQPSLLLAWGGVLAYACQLYFDFSGYSDMAIGLSRLFGIRLPLNFDSPYKADSIIEFWRRWHMTLSRFLRDYLYIALGGNRHGPLRRYLNLGATMLLGGLWHGAGWNYVIWGGLHGIYLMLNHGWAALARKAGWSTGGRAWRLASIVLTFVMVCFAWVFFRAADLPRALAIVHGMIGGNGVSLPDGIGYQLRGLKPLLESWGLTFYMGGGARFVQTWGWVALAMAVAWLAPNTQQIMRHFDPALDYDAARTTSRRTLAWRPNARWAAALAVLASLSLLSLTRPAEFLYFQF